MPLSQDNNLPSTVLIIRYTNENEIAFSCYLDSCAAMNTGNSLLHMWIMTTYPEILAINEHYNDSNNFEPYTLDSTIASSWIQSDYQRIYM